MNKLFTWVVGLANPLWARLGGDPHAIRLILRAKLIMDDRSGLVMGRRQAQNKGMEWFLYVMLLLFGAGLAIIPFFLEDLATSVGIAFSVWIIYIGLLLITEMSENLFDQRDLYVLLSRPINDITLSLARILHIAVFSSKFALCLGLPLGIVLAVKFGILPFVVYCLLSILTVAITMTGTLVFYLVMLRSVPKHRLKQIVGYFQMIATGIFFFAYQIPNLMGDSIKVFDGLVLVDEPLGFAFPGIWLGGLFKVLTLNGPGVLAILQGALAVAAAVGGLWFYIRQSKDYVSNLLALREVGSSEGPEAEAAVSVGESPWRERLAAWLTTPDLTRASFRFHWNVMLRDMGFKQRTYPAMIYLPVIFIILAFRDSFQEGDVSLGVGSVFMLLYFVAWIIIIPLGQTKISDDYRASWIFMATGNAHPGRLRYGQLMAVLAMFFIPTVFIIYPLVLIVWGPEYWIDVLLSSGNVLLATFIYHSLDSDLPFGRSKEDAKFSNIGPMILVSIAASISGFLHYFINDFMLVKVGLSVIVWIGVVLWLRSMRK